MSFCCQKSRVESKPNGNSLYEITRHHNIATIAVEILGIWGRQVKSEKEIGWDLTCHVGSKIVQVNLAN